VFERHILNEPIIRISRAFWGDYEPELIWASKKNCSGNFLKEIDAALVTFVTMGFQPILMEWFF
jgi:hypothetical protein